MVANESKDETGGVWAVGFKLRVSGRVEADINEMLGDKRGANLNEKSDRGAGGQAGKFRKL